MPDVTVSGFTKPRYEAVASAFRGLLESGEDVGAAFCATVEGETVVDLWGGWADEACTRPWARDTLVNVYSTTKTMTALTALLLADQGELDFDAKVAHYWPEFAANGKADVKVSHLMAHSAGLSGWRAPMTRDDLYDWEKATTLLAEQAPFWAPGTAPGYHAVTQGYLVGEVVRRITGRSLGTVFREEIAEPLGADFHIGLPASEDARVADLIPPPRQQPDSPPGELLLNMLLNPGIDPIDTRTRAWRGAEIPAAGGQGHARSVAEIHALLANGGVAKGKRLLSEAGCRRPLELQIEGVDLILGFQAKYGLGFGLSPMIPLPGPNAFFWCGYGGSLIVIDPDRHATYAYVMNKMGSAIIGDPRAVSLAKAVWEVVG
jgi:CubicO group peptidase (beta-lactamase class C family)